MLDFLRLDAIAYPGHADGRLFVFFPGERASPVWKPVVGHVDVTDMACLGAHVSSVYGFVVGLLS